MQLLRKVGDEAIIIYNPSKERVEVGENIKVVDEGKKRGIVVQVIEVGLVDLTGILEDIVRHEAMSTLVEVKNFTPKGVSRYMFDVKNMKMARVKILKELELKDDDLIIKPWSGWVPDRLAKISVFEDADLLEKLNLYSEYPIEVGTTAFSKVPLKISAYNLQGINIIVGKKGAGKSHMGKILLLGLIDHGAKAIVFDINNEYSSLRFLEENKKESVYHDKIIPLDPGKNLKFTLDYIGLDVMYDVLTTVLRLPDASAYTFRNIWNNCNPLTIDELINLADKENARVAEAIIRRLEQVKDTNLITNNPEKAVKIEDLLRVLSEGGALIINLREKSPVAVTITVQTILSKIRTLLEKGDPPLWIFAEEAHFYLNSTAWEDAITRMRHLGTYQVHLTNTPTAIPENVVRQADNLFLFHLSTQSDLEYIAPASKLDASTIIPIASALPPKRCLVVGICTNDYPLIIDTRQLKEKTAGETRLFFRKK